MTQDYVLCGWRVRSDITLSALSHWKEGDRPPDIHISHTDNDSREIPAGARQLSLLTWACEGGGWHLQVPQLGAFTVHAGREIAVRRCPTVMDEDLHAVLLGPVLAALCRQRRLLPLRATTIAYGNGAVAICGESGIGKSSLGWALARNGGRLISDGVSVLDIRSQTGQLRVHATHRGFQLWRAAVETLRIPPDEVVRTAAAVNRYAFWMHPSGFDASSVIPLRRIVIMSRRVTQPCILSGSDHPPAQQRLFNQLYLDGRYEGGLSQEELTSACSTICESVQLQMIPADGGVKAARVIGSEIAA